MIFYSFANKLSLNYLIIQKNPGASFRFGYKKNITTEEKAIKHLKIDNSESETHLEIGCYLPNWISQRRPLLSSSFNFKACSLSLPLLVNCVCACRSIHDETCPF